ncbi:MAG: hypothetical protein AAF468_06610 [Pseudomonadota bacterium]
MDRKNNVLETYSLNSRIAVQTNRRERCRFTLAIVLVTVAMIFTTGFGMVGMAFAAPLANHQASTAHDMIVVGVFLIAAISMLYSTLGLWARFGRIIDPASAQRSLS